jgi:WS/DGAT/MGAT family acyltransferase
MRQPLSAVDAAWLRAEDPTNLMMVTGVLLFDEPLRFDRFRAVVEERLLRYPRFRQRVREAAFGIGPPYWSSDEHFDLDAHIHHVALPAPADKEALERFVSDLLSTPLDFSKPLWQFHLVEHAGGSALVARIHHCIADGISLIQVLLSMTDPEARKRGRRATASRDPDSPGPTLDSEQGASLLQAAGWLASAGFGLVRNPAEALRLAGLGVEAAFTLAEVGLMTPDPPTPLKGPLGVSKRAAWSEPFPLAEVKAAGLAAGATINDVLVTAAAGGLRRYLAARGEPVDGLDLRATVPVNLRPLDEAHKLGNRFGLIFLALPLGLVEPAARLAEVKRRMDELKATLQPAVAYGTLQAIGYLPSAVQAVPVGFFGSKATAVLTNVPGPREPLYLAGVPMRQVMFWVPQSGRLGLGISILSYAGQVLVGVASDAGLVPDPQAIVDGFEAELAALM